MKINEEAARCMLCASPKCSKACPKKLDPARMLRAVRYENSECAAEFIALGCKNVQVTTAVMQYGYRIIDDLVSGLKAYMKRKNIAELNALAGSALKSIVPPEELDRSTVTYPVQMLMYGKEASNRKQEIDRQHYTIPNQRPKDKHCGKI